MALRGDSRRSSHRRTPATTIAGLCYLAVIAGGVFAEGAVRRSFFVPGDPAATAAAIVGNEMLWRLGIAVHLLYLVPGLTMKVLVTGLFRDGQPTLARLALVFGASAVTIEAVALVFLIVPLVAHDAAIATGVGDDAIVFYSAIRLFYAGFGISLLLFAGFCVGVGALILRSGRMPAAIGAAMIVAGALYVVNTLAMIVSPALFARINPGILLPIFLAEVSLAVWLLVFGIGSDAD